MSIDVKSQEVVASADKQPEQAAQTAQQGNFEKLRRKLEALEQEKQERDVVLKRQQETLEQLQAQLRPRSQDEDIVIEDSELVEGAKVKKLLARQEREVLKKAQEIARQTYQQIDSENFSTKLKSAYPDYDRVVNEQNVEKLQDEDPEFYAAVSEVSDNFKRREMCYKRIKKLVQQEEKPKVKAQDVVDENRKSAGAFYTPSGQGPMSNPYGFEFEPRNLEAKKKAYERLKAAQKRSF